MATNAQLHELLMPVVKALGFELWGIELQMHIKQRMLRVYIDSDDGITVDNCATVSRQLGATLDVEDVMPGEYLLEVSSPGMERPLFTLEQFERYKGHEIQLKLRSKFDGRKNFKGILQSTAEGELVIVAGEDEYTLPVELVEKAHLVPNFQSVEEE